MALDVMVGARRREQEGHDIVIWRLESPPRRRRARARSRYRRADGRPIGYTEALGRPSLRARIARHYREAYGVEVAPERVAVTTGSSGGFVLAFLALFDAGARVAIAAPGYPAYRNILEALALRQ